MKDKILPVIVIIIVSLLFSYNTLSSYFNNLYGNYLYEQGDYNSALKYHNKAFKSDNTKTSLNNKLNDYYKLNDYETFQKIYEQNRSCEEKNEVCFRYFHNAGNNYYRLGQNIDNTDEVSQFWNESLVSYQNALDIQFDEETKKNYDFVKDRLDELSKQENEQDDSQKSNDESSDTKDQGDEKENSNKSNGDQENENKESNESENNEENGSEENKKNGEDNEGISDKDSDEGGKEGESGKPEQQLSEEQKAQLKRYYENLKEQQKSNQKYFNKKSEPESNDPFDVFRNDPFFNNSILNQEGKKDW